MYDPAVQSHASLRNRSRRFIRKYGLHLFLVFVVGGVLALVILLMYVLTVPGHLPGT